MEVQISLYNKKGKKLQESFKVEYDGKIGTGFKNHYLNYAKMFVNPETESIEVNE